MRSRNLRTHDEADSRRSRGRALAFVLSLPVVRVVVVLPEPAAA